MMALSQPIMREQIFERILASPILGDQIFIETGPDAVQPGAFTRRG